MKIFPVQFLFDMLHVLDGEKVCNRNAWNEMGEAFGSGIKKEKGRILTMFKE